MIHRVLRAAWTLTRAPFAQNGQVITIAWRGSNLSLCAIEVHRRKYTYSIQFFTVFFLLLQIRASGEPLGVR